MKYNFIIRTIPQNFERAVNAVKNNYKPAIPLSFLFWFLPDQNDINNKPFFKKIIKMIKSAKKCEALKEFQEADTMYHEALMHLHEYERDGNADPLEVSQARSYLFDSMADMAMREGKLDKAEVLYKSVISELLSKQNFKEDDNAVIEISLKLAMIYAEQGKNEVATMGYNYCIEALENKLGIGKNAKNKNDKDESETAKQGDEKEEEELDKNTLTLYGICLDSLANFLYSLNELSKALPFFEKALDISVKVFSSGSHSQIGVIHNSIGVILSDLQQHENAVKHFEKAIEIGEQCESPDLGIYFFNLAEVKRQMDLSDEALINYRRAHIASSQQPHQQDLLIKINKALEDLNGKNK